MSKLKYILLSSMAILVCLFTSVAVPINKVSADTTEPEIYNTYTYTDSTCDEYYGSSVNAIDKVVSADITYSPVITYTFTCDEDISFYFLTYGMSGSAYNCYDKISYTVRDLDLYDKVPTNVNIEFSRINCGDSVSKFWFEPVCIDLGGGYSVTRFGLYAGADYEVRFHTYLNNSNYTADLLFNSTIYDLNSIVDMQASTNTEVFNREILNTVNSNKYQSYILTNGSGVAINEYSQLSRFSQSSSYYFNYFPEGLYFKDSRISEDFCNETFTLDSFSDFYNYNYDNGDGWLYNVSDSLYLTTFGIEDYKGKVCCYMGSNVDEFTSNLTMSYSLDIYNFEVLIDMPTYRSQNSLLIYNYDYNSMLSSVNSVSYRLLRDKCYYDIIYNGSIPNKQVLVVNNSNITNMTFSNYIYVKFTFDGLVPVRNDGTLSTGFDFNFGNYVEPFPQITVNSSEATFDRPDLPTDLTPRLNFEKTDSVPWFKISLYFPVVKYIEYAFIWLLFYCPVIGDCTAFLYTFFGKFLDIFNIIIELPLGTFVVSFICFILCFKLFSYFVPFLSNKTSVAIKNISNKSSDSMKSNKEFIKEQNKEKEKERRLHKQTKKIMSKSIKKYNKQINKKR